MHKVSPESSPDDTPPFLERLYQDFSCHSIFAEVVRKVSVVRWLMWHQYLSSPQRFTMLAANFDVDSLSHLVRLLYNNELALDMVSLYIGIPDLVVHALALLE